MSQTLFFNLLTANDAHTINIQLQYKRYHHYTHTSCHESTDMFAVAITGCYKSRNWGLSHAPLSLCIDLHSTDVKKM